MAYGAVASLLQTLDQILHPVENQMHLHKLPIELLQQRLSFLLGILDDSSNNNVEVGSWITGIRDTAYGAEDIVEVYTSVILPAFDDNQERGSFCKVLQQILKRFDSIKKAAMKTGGKGCITKNLESWSSSRLTSSGKSDIMVGLDEDLVQIKDRLTGSASKLEIISILGMGGIGKTTLARSIYDDPFIVYHFHRRAWVAVSQQYSFQEILLGILSSVNNQNEDQMRQESDDILGERLYKSLKGNRYLIVIDDVWDTNIWDNVKIFFPDDNNGSRILLTTRQSHVALYANSSGLHHQMHFLNEAESWNLLHKKVFANDSCPPELEEIGKRIAQNCQGLPLTILVIAGLLSKSSKTRDYWEQVAENVSSVVSVNDEQCLEILAWSYNYLPHHLKACLLYFGAFPAAHDVPISKLIKLWAAEGFLKPMANKSSEEAAEDYLDDLIGRNLIMVQKHRFNGEMKTCSIHDLLREICLREAKKEKFVRVINSVEFLPHQSPNDQRRLGILSDIRVSLNNYNPYVRTLLYFAGRLHPLYLSSFTAYFKLLRVLDILAVQLDAFPIELVALVTLRYLAFVSEGTLPASISKLFNLQTLTYYRAKKTTFVDEHYLPVEIWMLPRLRHLYINGSALPDPSGAQIAGDNSVLLGNLETFRVKDLRLSEEVLRMIPNLKKLKITYTPHSEDEISSYNFKNLVSLHQLETLKCIFVATYASAFSDATKLNLVFPPGLKNLTLGGCKIPWKNMSIIGSLPNLEALKLQMYAFTGREWEATEGEFCRLEYLQLQTIRFTHWIADETHFPRLKGLIIRECFDLEKIPSEFGDISTLEIIEMDDSSESAVTSAMEILEEQQDLGNDCLQVRVYPNIFTGYCLPWGWESH